MSATKQHAWPHSGHPFALHPTASPSAGASAGGKDVPSSSHNPPQAMGLHQKNGAVNNYIQSMAFGKLQVFMGILPLEKHTFLQEP